MQQYLLPIYHKLPVTFSHGSGIWLSDKQGKQYLDALSGIGVCALGHNHPKITQAIIEQASQLLLVPNTYYTDAQSRLAKLLCNATGLTGAYFSNSGAEANETAIKMALKYGTSQKNYSAPKIIVMEGGFYGRSLGAWSASCDVTKETQFGPLLDSFIRVPFNQIEPIQQLAAQAKHQALDIAAVMLEPILGKGGLVPADIAYLQQLRQLCDEQDWLLICDEVQSGIGRTGKLFAYQHANIQPDIVTTAKALGNGIPIGAYISSKKASLHFKPGDHGSTQGGNVFACHVALAVLETLETENLYQNAILIGEYLQQQLNSALSKFELFETIQGKGLMIGIKLKRSISNSIQTGLTHGIIFNHAGKNIIRLLPPLILTQSDADQIVARISACFEDFAKVEQSNQVN